MLLKAAAPTEAEQGGTDTAQTTGRASVVPQSLGLKEMRLSCQ